MIQIPISEKVVPDDQESEIYSKVFNGTIDNGGVSEQLFSFGESKDTKFNVSNLTVGVTGSQFKVDFGKRVSGFYTQYLPSYTIDVDGFGTDPVLEEMVVYLPATEFSGDTTIVNRYNVYMVMDDSFLDGVDEDKTRKLRLPRRRLYSRM